MVKDITKDKLAFLLITSLIFSLSCSLPSAGILPLPNIGYLPQNDVVVSVNHILVERMI
jgi:hypothetical protein